MKIGTAPAGLPGRRWIRMVRVVGAGLAEWLALWRSRRRHPFGATASKAERLRRAPR
jgi:hypothetical protein